MIDLDLCTVKVFEMKTTKAAYLPVRLAWNVTTWWQRWDCACAVPGSERSGPVEVQYGKTRPSVSKEQHQTRPRLVELTGTMSKQTKLTSQQAEKELTAQLQQGKRRTALRSR